MEVSRDQLQALLDAATELACAVARILNTELPGISIPIGSGGPATPFTVDMPVDVLRLAVMAAGRLYDLDPHLETIDADVDWRAEHGELWPRHIANHPG